MLPINRIKNNYKNIPKQSVKPEFFTISDQDNLLITNAYITLDAPFKIIKIKLYPGSSFDILDPKYDGFSIVKSSNSMTITNYKKTLLNEDFLFRFSGYLVVTKVTVYLWGENSRIASLSKNRDVSDDTMSNSDNVVSSTGTIFNADEKRRVNAEEYLTENPIPPKMENTINGFYTKGTRLKYKSKRYIGYYHYNHDLKKYMTGSYPKPSSVTLKPIRRSRRRNGL